MWDNHVDYISNKEYKKIQEGWVRHYADKLRSKHYWASKHTKAMTIQEYYREGRLLNRLALIDFNEFEMRLKQEYPYYYWGSKKWKWNRIRNHYKYNRGNGKKFQKANYKKRELSEQELTKREWRKFKKDPRDQKFHKKYRGSTNLFKYNTKRSHRAFEKHCIANSQFEKLHNRTWKEREDWWMYD